MTVKTTATRFARHRGGGEADRLAGLGSLGGPPAAAAPAIGEVTLDSGEVIAVR